MTFARGLREGTCPVALEITPPRQLGRTVLLRRAALLGDYCSAINVISRPERVSSLDASIALASGGFAPAWHLAVRDKSREEVAGQLGRARAAGLTQVLVLKGESAGPGALLVRDAVEMTVAALTGALVGASFNQYAADADRELGNLAGKLRAGARYVQTQPVFELASCEPLLTQARHAGAEHSVAMVMPLLQPDAVNRIEARLGLRIPESLRRAIDAGPEAAWEAFADNLGRLVASPLVDGVAVMTFEMDPPAEVGERVVAALRQAGIRPAASVR